MRIIVPPIKSPGIKTQLVPWIQALIPEVTGRWIEPILGTGVVAFNSGFEHALLSDTNPHVIEFYRRVQEGIITPARVRNDLEQEGDRLRRAGNKGYDHFTAIKDRFNRHHDLLDFLFLPRAGFNGMMRFNRKGEWNIPFCRKPERFGTAYITKIANQVQDVARVIQSEWEFVVASFEETIAQATADDLRYCDPPYVGRYVDYYNGWTDEDERRLYELLSATPAKFILSTWHHNEYRKNLRVQRYWRRFNLVTRNHFYHSGAKIENRCSIVEALVFNFGATAGKQAEDTRSTEEQPSLLDLKVPHPLAGCHKKGKGIPPPGRTR